MPTPSSAISTRSLHDALPISLESSSTPLSQTSSANSSVPKQAGSAQSTTASPSSSTPLSQSSKQAGQSGSRQSTRPLPRSEEHTSELQSRLHLVCRLLLEKKK